MTEREYVEWAIERYNVPWESQCESSQEMKDIKASWEEMLETSEYSISNGVVKVRVYWCDTELPDPPLVQGLRRYGSPSDNFSKYPPPKQGFWRMGPATGGPGPATGGRGQPQAAEDQRQWSATGGQGPATGSQGPATGVPEPEFEPVPLPSGDPDDSEFEPATGSQRPATGSQGTAHGGME